MKKESHKFNINNPVFYQYGNDISRTRKRLIEIADLGMHEVGLGLFGYKNIMIGLYIEMVWSYTDEDFKDYLDWVKGLSQIK